MERNSCFFPEDQRPILQQQQQQLLLQTNVKLGNEEVLIEDVLVEILSRVPGRHLVRLRCVCRSWRALIDDINFIKRHYQLQYSICKAHGDTPFIYITHDLEARVFLLSKQLGYVPLDLTIDLVHDTAIYFAEAPGYLFDSVYIAGIVNGVVCFDWGCEKLGLWNPATREFKAVPPFPNDRTGIGPMELLGLGFDCISNDFKIVRGINFDRETYGHEVYSLATNSWKRLSEASPVFRSCGHLLHMQAYLNGVCYWTFELPSGPVILSFNFRTEVFQVFNEPPNASGSKIGYMYSRKITMYKECLALVVSRTDMGKAVCNFDVWVATEFLDRSGIPVSWQHLFTIGPFPWSDRLSLGAFTETGDVLFLIIPRCVFIDEDESGPPFVFEDALSRGPFDGDESRLYNPSTRTFKNLGFRTATIFTYVESLFPLTESD